MTPPKFRNLAQDEIDCLKTVVGDASIKSMIAGPMLDRDGQGLGTR